MPLYVASDDATERLTNARKLAARLQSGELTLADVFGDCRSRNKGSHILLIADQFEEVFTQIEDEVLRRRFIDVLLTGFPAEQSSSGRYAKHKRASRPVDDGRSSAPDFCTT